MFGIFTKSLPWTDSLIKNEKILHLSLNRGIDRLSLLSCHLVLRFLNLSFWLLCQICLAKFINCGLKLVKKTEREELSILF